MVFNIRTPMLGLLTAVGASMLTSCKSGAPPSVEASSVPYATVQPSTLANDLTLSAEFRPYQEVDVMAKIAGYVKDIRVDIGDHVQQGEVLAVLEVPEIQDELAKAKAGVATADANIVTAEAAVTHARAAANIAHLSFQRIHDVATRDKGLVPRQDVDVAQSRDLEAAAELASANSALKAAQELRTGAESEYSRAQAMSQYATIRAPFTGVITKRYANQGSMIQAGTSSQSQAMPVVRIAQNDTLRVIVPVPVNSVAGIKDGQPVEVNVTNLGIMIRGNVTRYANALQMTTRTMDTEIDVPNHDGKLVPGMYAEVHLHLAARPDVLSLPLDAVDGLGTSAQQVYLVQGDLLRLIKITTGLQTSSRVEILSGLKRGDKVVVGRHSGLSDGEKVDARPASYESNVGQS